MKDNTNESNIYEHELLISGIQHYGYCKRQWMLIHVEGLWNENVFTFKGNTVHERVDDPTFKETRGNIRRIRSMQVRSSMLNVHGVADLVEIIKSADSTNKIFPYEYKSGKPKESNWDAYQLCLVAMALEEMMKVKINRGYLYYHKIRRKLSIDFDAVLRKEVTDLILEMQNLYNKGKTVTSIETSKCYHCSMRLYCIPLINKKKKTSEYYKEALREVEDEEALKYTICDERPKSNLKER